MKRSEQVLLALVGPTASGKTHLGMLLAGRLNGEIVSADSRQVTGIWTLALQNRRPKTFVMSGIILSISSIRRRITMQGSTAIRHGDVLRNFLKKTFNPSLSGEPDCMCRE